MKRSLVLLTAAALLAASVSASAATAADDPAPATPASCQASWTAMVQSGTTGGVTHDQFMKSCLPSDTSADAGSADALILVAAGLAGAVGAVTQHPDRPTSP